MSEAVENSRVELRSYFVRQRNALVVRAGFSLLYVDHYLHLMQHGMRLEPQPDAMLKEALAAMTLHLCSRPWNEVSAWTLNFQEPLLNVFVTGDSRLENVIGRIFTEDVRRNQRSLFYAQVRVPNRPVRQSTVEIVGDDVFRAVEQYYAQSEQRRARYFRFAEEEFVMISSQPQCDEAWLESLDDAAVRRLDHDEELSLLEQRYYQFDCGCSIERVYSALAPLGPESLADVFRDDTPVRVNCPRCGAGFEVTREGLREHTRSE